MVLFVLFIGEDYLRLLIPHDDVSLAHGEFVLIRIAVFEKWVQFNLPIFHLPMTLYRCSISMTMNLVVPWKGLNF